MKKIYILTPLFLVLLLGACAPGDGEVAEQNQEGENDNEMCGNRYRFKLNAALRIRS